MYWSLVEEHCFGLACEKIFGSARAADIALDAVKWTLVRERGNFARYPLIKQTHDGPLYALATSEVPAFSSITVYFTVDVAQRQVTLRDITL